MSDDRRLVVFVTARMRSQRFPGKALGRIGPKTLIEHVIDGALMLKGVNTVVATIGDDREDVPLSGVCASAGISVYQGSGHNLMERHMGAISTYRADYFLVLSGDVPFLHVPLVQRIVNAFRDNHGYDWYEGRPHDYPAFDQSAAIRNAATVTRIAELLDDVTHEKRLHLVDHYHVLQNDLNEMGEIRKFLVDVDDLMPSEKTPLKTSIDHRLELALANVVWDFVGHRPSPDDYRRAYDSITQLTAVSLPSQHRPILE